MSGEIPKTMVPVMSLDKAGNDIETLRPLSEVMDELDEQIEAADRIEACASGKPAESVQAGLGL